MSSTYTQGMCAGAPAAGPSSSLKIISELSPSRNSIHGCPWLPSSSGSAPAGSGSGEVNPNVAASHRAAAAGRA
jgi:hypothetical protein